VRIETPETVTLNAIDQLFANQKEILRLRGLCFIARVSLVGNCALGLYTLHTVSNKGMIQFVALAFLWALFVTVLYALQRWGMNRISALEAERQRIMKYLHAIAAPSKPRTLRMAAKN
jgi:hypothetical protein